MHELDRVCNIYNSLNLQGYPDLLVLADMSPFMTLLIAEVRVMYTVMILDIHYRTRNTTCHLNCGGGIGMTHS